MASTDTHTPSFPEAPSGVPIRKVAPGEYGNLFERAQAVAKNMSMPAPGIWVVSSSTINAEAHPSNNVVITTGMLKLLNEREQNAVIAHEIGHQKDGDKEGFLGNIKIIANVFQGHLPEYREMQADDRSIEAAYKSGEHTHSPDDLMNALKKMKAYEQTHSSDFDSIKLGHAPGIQGAIQEIAIGSMEKTVNLLPDSVKKSLSFIAVSLNNLIEEAHLGSHPSLDNRVKNIEYLKEQHDKSTSRVR